MQIQIYGAGIAGSYLYELLSQNGFNVKIYDLRSKPDCRCAWGIMYSEAKELYKQIGINLDDYILSKPKEVIINNKIILKNKNVVIFDRKKLLEDLWRDFKFEKTDADIVVDATGCSRAILPKIENDSIYCTVQSIEKHDLDENIYIQMRKTGYAWAFPLGNGWPIVSKGFGIFGSDISSFGIWGKTSSRSSSWGTTPTILGAAGSGP